jgi:decaprenyl-phosphate phosphoribosyltransferase
MGFMGTLRALAKTLRPHQWVKNLFVAAPLVFAKKLTDVPVALTALAAVAAFCALSGAVYALNDVLDVDKDRAHPTKRKRPIASGRLSARLALGVGAVLAVGALAGATLLSPSFGIVAGGYLTLNLLYSLRIKDIVFLDVLAIAAGFLLRVLGGAFAIDVPASPWLLACTGLLAAFLGFGKRAHELRQATSGAADSPRLGETRKVLLSYRPDHLRLALYVLGAATTAAYAVYTRSAHTVSFFGTGNMIWTAPFCLAGILRFMRLVTRPGRTDSPTEEMLRDVPFMLNLGLWGAAVLAIIYFR